MEEQSRASTGEQGRRADDPAGRVPGTDLDHGDVPHESSVPRVEDWPVIINPAFAGDCHGFFVRALSVARNAFGLPSRSNPTGVEQARAIDVGWNLPEPQPLPDLASLRTVEFRETLIGYHRDEIDDYLERAAVEADVIFSDIQKDRTPVLSGATFPALGKLRTVTFRRDLKGYHRDDVDKYLLRVVNELDSLGWKVPAPVPSLDSLGDDRPIGTSTPALEVGGDVRSVRSALHVVTPHPRRTRNTRGRKLWFVVLSVIGITLSLALFFAALVPSPGNAVRPAGGVAGVLGNRHQSLDRLVRDLNEALRNPGSRAG